MTYISHLLILTLKHDHWRANGKIVRGMCSRWWPQENSDFWTQRKCCTYGLTTVVDSKLKTWTISRQTKFGLEEGIWTWSVSIAVELLLIDTIWEKRSWFCLRIWLLVGPPCSSGRTNIWVHGYHKLDLLGFKNENRVQITKGIVKRG